METERDSIEKRYGVVDTVFRNGKIHLFLRGEDGSLTPKTEDFTPFFYIESETGNFTTVLGSRVKKFHYYYKPFVTSEEMSKVYEYDISPEDRYLLDKGIGFSLGREFRGKIRKLFIDIETGSEGVTSPKDTKDPICSIQTYDNFTKKVTMYLWRVDLFNSTQEGEFVTYHQSSTEIGMLNLFIEDIVSSSPDMIIGWNCDDFDYPYLYNRCRKLGVPFERISPFGEVRVDRNWITGRSLVDLMNVYKGYSFYELKDASLDGVAKKELGVNKEKVRVTMKELWETNLEGLKSYAIKDVVLCYLIDEKLTLTDLLVELKEISGVKFDRLYTVKERKVKFPSFKVVDKAMMMLRHDVVFPSQVYGKTEEEGYEGTPPMTPIKGRYEDVAVFDFQSLYPSIIIAGNISYETIDPNGDVNLGGTRFKSYPPGIIPTVLRKLVERRMYYKDAFKKTGEQVYFLKDFVYKRVLNRFYGCFAFSGFRMHRLECAAATTWVARQIVDFMKRKLKEIGIEVIYTDSVTPDTPILCKDSEGRLNFISIQELWEEPEKFRYVWAGKWSKIKDVIRKRRKTGKRILKVSTREGCIKCTEDHSLIQAGKEISPKNLHKGEIIDTVSFPEILKEKSIGFDWAGFLGFFCAEGTAGHYKYSHGNKSSFAIGLKDTEENLKILERMKEILASRGFKTNINHYMECHNKRGETSPSIKLQNGGKELVSLLSKTCYTRGEKYLCGIKKVPVEVLNAPLEEVKEFLRWYEIGDSGKNPRTNHLVLESSSMPLAVGLQFLYNRLDIELGAYIRKDKDTIRFVNIRNPKDKRRTHKGQIRKIMEDSYQYEYVYDISTEEERFAAGCGMILAHNTDSLFVPLRGNDSQQIKDFLNKVCLEFAEEANLLPIFEIDIQKVYDKFFIGTKKKKYAGERNGELEVVGYDARKSDTPTISERVQKNLLKMILDGKSEREAVDYISLEMKRTYLGRYPPRDLAIRRGLGRERSDYKVRTIHVRAIDYAMKLGMSWSVAEKPLIIYVNPPKEHEEADVIAFFDDLPEGFVPDYSRIVPKFIIKKVKGIFEDMGWDFRKVLAEHKAVKNFGQSRLTEWARTG